MNGTKRSSSRARALGTALAALLAAHGAVATVATAQEAPRLNEVKVPLRDYLALVESVQREEKERAVRAANRTAPLAEVVSQSTRVSFGDKTVIVKADFEVLVQGQPKSVVHLPANFVVRSAEVEPAGAKGAAGQPVRAALSASTKQLFLVAAASGSYTVRLEGDAKLTQEGGTSRYLLAPVVAPVAVTEVDLPADRVWNALGAVVVEDRVEGERRHVRFTARRGTAPTFEVHRRMEDGDAERLLAHAEILTLFQLGAEGAQRHDVILYEVSRGALGSFTVDLPPGLEIEKAGTDEGEVVPVTEARRLTLHRRGQLQKSGYLVLTSTPDAAADLTLAPILPGVEVRARYLAVASTVASEARPQPEGIWNRVDLADLPSSFRDALSALDPTAAWRLAGKGGDEGAGSRLQVARVRPASQLAAVVRLRETTTVVTVDGTVLHRDRFVLHPVAGLTAALDLTLPPGGTLWSAKVDGQPIRPLEKDGVVTIPLGFNEGKGPVVEVVSVLEKALPKGKAHWSLDLPRLAVPVQDHRWRLLLPAGARYRFKGGDLQPEPAAVASTWRGSGRMVTKRQTGVPSGVEGGVIGGTAGVVAAPPQSQLIDSMQIARGDAVSQTELEQIPTARDPWQILANMPGVLTDRINVGGNESGQQSYYAGPEAFKKLKSEVADLRNGLVGGVRSLPVTIPETGKVLAMSGLLPPERIAVELEVKGGK